MPKIRYQILVLAGTSVSVPRIVRTEAPQCEPGRAVPGGLSPGLERAGRVNAVDRPYAAA